MIRNVFVLGCFFVVAGCGGPSNKPPSAEEIKATEEKMKTEMQDMMKMMPAKPPALSNDRSKGMNPSANKK